MTDLLETVRDTLADTLGVRVSIPDAEAVIDALSVKGFALDPHPALPPAPGLVFDPMLAALAGSSGRAPGAFDDKAYRE